MIAQAERLHKACSPVRAGTVPVDLSHSGTESVGVVATPLAAAPLGTDDRMEESVLVFSNHSSTSGTGPVRRSLEDLAALTRKT